MTTTPMTMSYVLACAAVFVAAYLVNIFYITVFYHRAFTHRVVGLQPFTRKIAVATGNWITGLDPKAWSCMHRLHHLHADTPLDPHSPSHNTLAGLMLVQLHAYNSILRRLIKREPVASALVADLDFEVNWLNRRRLWILPYLLHAVVGMAIAVLGHAWLLGAAYYVGMMSHPVQGWMVNALAHRFGYRNFETPDDSRNNTFVALAVFGEGYQNNHHHDPTAVNFAVKPGEFDGGYYLCLLAEKLGMVTLATPPSRTPAREAAVVELAPGVVAPEQV